MQTSSSRSRTTSSGLILSEARKYGLTLTIAHQYLNQISEGWRSAVFGNVGSLIALRSGARTRDPLEQIGLQGADALLDLPNFGAWCACEARPADLTIAP